MARDTANTLHDIRNLTTPSPDLDLSIMWSPANFRLFWHFQPTDIQKDMEDMDQEEPMRVQHSHSIQTICKRNFCMVSLNKTEKTGYSDNSRLRSHFLHPPINQYVMAVVVMFVFPSPLSKFVLKALIYRGYLRTPRINSPEKVAMHNSSFCHQGHYRQESSEVYGC